MHRSCNEKLITEGTIKIIEKSLNIKLYDMQKKFLLGEIPVIIDEKPCGKTYAYMIKLALSEGKELNLRNPLEFADGHTLDYAIKFREQFLLIRSLLEYNGLRVRKIKF